MRNSYRSHQETGHVKTYNVFKLFSCCLGSHAPVLLSLLLLLGILTSACSPDQLIAPLIVPSATLSEEISFTDTPDVVISPTDINTPTYTITPTNTQTQTPTNTPTITPTFTPAVETFELKITQDQFSSIVDSGFSSAEEATMENNRVVLKNGQIEIYSQVTQMGFTLPMEAVVAVSVDTCKPVANIKSSSVGPFSLPDYGKEEMKAMVKGILLEEVEKISENACIQNIEIEDGVIILSGEIQN
jgi:hypothetical protein